MGKISVVYWSQAGNTLAMAEAIGKGITDGGAQAEVVNVSSCQVSDLDTEEVFALGCPAMGAEVLEESEMEPFVAELEENVKGKKIALFGSYGWGDGEWMRNWVEECESLGVDMACDSVICNEMPDDAGKAECEALGAALV